MTAYQRRALALRLRAFAEWVDDGGDPWCWADDETGLSVDDARAFDGRAWGVMVPIEVDGKAASEADPYDPHEWDE